MSGWDAYITNLMDSSSCIKKAAIVGSQDGGIWARSSSPGADFVATAEELRKFVALFDKLNDPEIFSSGFYLEGTRFIVPRTEENLIFGKRDKTGVFAVKTNMAVLIAHYEGENDKGLECRTAVERMGQYLQSQGY